MKKNFIINIPMTANIQKMTYMSDDESLAVSDRMTAYPSVPYFEKNTTVGDEVKFILLTKQSTYSRWEQFAEDYIEEIKSINAHIGADVTFEILNSEFSETRYVHEKLMERIVEQISDGSNVVADITYGPKDLPIVVFSAFEFAERFLGCNIERILYGQIVFNEKGVAEEPKVCDMAPLYALSSLTNTITCDDPDKARKMLKSIVSL